MSKLIPQFRQESDDAPIILCRSIFYRYQRFRGRSPKCNSEHIYSDGMLWNCPECSYEWNGQESEKSDESVAKDTSVRDASGNVLVTGDSISVIKDLKVKGSGSVVKVGMKIKNIRIIESEDGHNIACKIDGIGALNLKSEFVKKV